MNTTTNVEVTMGGGSRGSTLAEFEQIYRANVGVLTAYFARRCTDPQTVADLTSETIVGAAGSFRSFDSGSGSARAWLFRIAAHVYADYCAQTANGRETVVRLVGMGDLPVDEIDELADRIDAQRAGRPRRHFRTSTATPSAKQVDRGTDEDPWLRSLGLEHDFARQPGRPRRPRSPH
jgi:DNA-directed RNA polymerase specialized sigma24 family protein